MYLQTKKIIAVIFLASMLSSCITGVLAVGAIVLGSGTYMYISGEYIIEIPKDIKTVYNATIKTMQSTRGYSISTHTSTLDEADVDGTVNGETVNIHLTNQGSKSTEIKIRVGTFGDEVLSANIANQIGKNIT